MPFIDGESLRQRLRRSGRPSIGEAVRILRQLADALAHAHARGVVHRDVKSDNVLVADRDVFLADFGIARALGPHGPDATMTGTGMMVGTPGYMSPEQVVGGPVDYRADIYAFGALAYEVLAGAPPFTGSAQDVVGAQLSGLPETVTRHRPDIPPALAAMVMRCLQRIPQARWQRMDELLAVLDSVETQDGGSKASNAGRWRTRLALAAALVAVASMATAWYVTRSTTGSSPSLEVGRMTRVTTDPGLELDPAVSPDGRAIAYAAGPPGRMRIYVRQIAGGRSMPVTGDDVAVDEAHRWPQWSPDGLRIVYQGGRQRYTLRLAVTTPMLYEVPALGGTPRRLLASVPGRVALSPSWSHDAASVVFGAADGLAVVPTAPADAGGTPQMLVSGMELHSPRWSPDGTKIAYVKGASLFTFGEEMMGNVSTSMLLIVTPATGRVSQITSGEWLDTNPIWLPGRPKTAVRVGPRRRAGYLQHRGDGDWRARGTATAPDLGLERAHESRSPATGRCWPMRRTRRAPTCGRSTSPPQGWRRSRTPPRSRSGARRSRKWWCRPMDNGSRTTRIATAWQTSGRCGCRRGRRSRSRAAPTTNS